MRATQCSSEIGSSCHGVCPATSHEYSSGWQSGGAARLRVTGVEGSGHDTAQLRWKKTHGWIEPECRIDHPDIGKHQGMGTCVRGRAHAVQVPNIPMVWQIHLLSR